jgi:hypothetical protein
MAAVIAFHVVMVALGVSVASGLVSTARVSTALGYLHNTVGISTPLPGQVRMIALVWIGSTIVIADGCVLLLVLIAKVLQ